MQNKDKNDHGIVHILDEMWREPPAAMNTE